jgi:hypothetical protein
MSRMDLTPLLFTALIRRARRSAPRLALSALLLSFCRKKQENEEEYMGCGFPALVFYV